MTELLQHGGQLTAIAQQYGIATQHWLDLSTGIASQSYPIPSLDPDVWRRLPEPSADLLSAAQQYYGAQSLLPIPGSQSLIQFLPQLCKQQGYSQSTVWLPELGYKEHQKAWTQSGFERKLYRNVSELNNVRPRDIVLLINPNNPTGQLLPLQQSVVLLQQLHAKQALMIVDEAFMDTTPEHSLLSHLHAMQTYAGKSTSSLSAADTSGLIVLRSVGKFFGLAGIRLGFVAADPFWLALIQKHLGPWSINGPAQAVATAALQDHHWQQQQRRVLHTRSRALALLLQNSFSQQPAGTALFQTVTSGKAPQVFHALCQHAIYVRLTDEQNALRFGIPDEQGLARLRQALESTQLINTLKP